MSKKLQAQCYGAPASRRRAAGVPPAPARVERWLAKAVVAASVGDVLDE